MRLRFEDNIFNRAHSLKQPNINDDLPILIQDNPSRDFFFPLSVEEVFEALKALPKNEYEGITHIWLRRLKKTDFINNEKPLAEFICGSGVRVIVLYPWERTMLQNFGVKKPSNRKINEYQRYGVDIKKSGNSWKCKWNINNLRKYYINNLLYHEVGHHVDWYFRYWSKANLKQVEEFADQYAIQKTATATHVFNRLRNR